MTRSTLIALVAGGLLPFTTPMAQAAPCLIVTITGAGAGPQVYQGQAGPGTLIRYGDDVDNCNTVRLQFDAGRGTLLRLSQLNVLSSQVNAIFFTHMHSDHSEGFIDLLQHRWHTFPASPKIDVVCSDDVTTPLGFTISCKKFVAHIADALMHAGEIAQRASENKQRLKGGPAALANVKTFAPRDEPQVVWSSGDVQGERDPLNSHGGPCVLSHRHAGRQRGDRRRCRQRHSRPAAPLIDFRAGGELAKGADIIVHSTTHPVMGPDRDSGTPPAVFYRQSLASDLGAMAQRAGVRHLVLTHVNPPPGAPTQGPRKVPGGPLTEADYRKAAQDGGFTGHVVVATDLASVRLPAK